MIAIVSHKKNINVAPSYAYIIEDTEDNGFTYNPDNGYGVVWIKHSKLYADIDPCDDNLIYFSNTSIYGGCIRTFQNTIICKFDENHDAFTYIYYPNSKDLYCIALSAAEACFGGIVIRPVAYNNPLVKKYIRHQYLMNKWRKLTPLIGKWSLFFNNLYTEVTYRPGNLGALTTKDEFERLCFHVSICMI